MANNQNNPRPPLQNTQPGAGLYCNAGGSLSAYTNIFAHPGNYSVTWNWNVPQQTQPAPMPTLPTALTPFAPTMANQTGLNDSSKTLVGCPMSPIQQFAKPSNAGTPDSGVFVNGSKTGFQA